MSETERTNIDGNQVGIEHVAKGSPALVRLAAIKAWIREGNDGLLPDPGVADGMESTGRVYKVTIRLHDRDEFQRYASVVRWIDDGAHVGPFNTSSGNADTDSEPTNADGSDSPPAGDSVEDPKPDGPTPSL